MYVKRERFLGYRYMWFDYRAFIEGSPLPNRTVIPLYHVEPLIKLSLR